MQKNQDPGEQNLLATKTAPNIGYLKPNVKNMSLFPDYLELQRNQSWAIDQKSDSHIPRNSMNKLVMDYLITGIYLNKGYELLGEYLNRTHLNYSKRGIG